MFGSVFTVFSYINILRPDPGIYYVCWCLHIIQNKTTEHVMAAYFSPANTPAGKQKNTRVSLFSFYPFFPLQIFFVEKSKSIKNNITVNANCRSA